MANNNKEAKIKFTAETGEFNSTINKASQTMSKLRLELKLNETQMKNTGASVEALENKQSLLENQLVASQSKTEALTQKVAKAVEIFGANSNEVSNLKQKLLLAQTAEEKIKEEISKCAKELEEQKRATLEAESATGKLTKKIDSQQSELTKLKKAYTETIIEFGDTSNEAQILAREIEDLSSELKNSKKEFSDATKKANDLDKSLEDVGDSARNTEDGFTIAKGAVADLASNAIQAAIGKVSEFISYLYELPEATREIRQDMATLETSFKEAGYTSEQATKTWKELYKVFGEDDRAVEAANQIAKMTDNQEELNSWVTITKGIWASYQDSLPVEGLAEASSETSKTGKVTGVLADALNWSSEAAKMFGSYMSEDVTTAEDAFNVALSECTNEQERQALITETLTKLYGGAAKKYEEASGTQLEAKEVTAENILVQNELANTVEPLTTAWQGMKTEILTGIIPAVKKFSEWGVGAIGWMKEHPVLMKVLAAVLGVVATALGALIVVVTAYTVAQWAMNSAILANPITWIIVAIVAAIAAVVAIIVVVIEYWDKIVVAVKNACTSVINAIQVAWDWIKSIFSTVGNWINTNVIQPVLNFFKSLWDGIKSVWDGIVNVVKFAIMLIGSIISAAVNIITLPFRFIWENCKDVVFAAWDWIKKTVTTAINAVKNTITNVMNAIKNFLSPILNAIKNTFSSVWNSIKTAVTTAVNAVKSVVSSVWNGIKEVVSNVMNAIKTKVSSVWNGIKSTISSVVSGIRNTISSGFNAVKSIATNVFNSVKNAIMKPINAAKDGVKNALDKIKGFFSGLKLKFPKIKMPHFKIEGKFSLSPPSVPKLAIDWYKEGGIMMKPTIFGVNGTRLMGGGEAGPEAIIGIEKLQGYIVSAIDRTIQKANINSLVNAIMKLADRPIVIDINGREFALATASDSDSVNGLRNSIKTRGLIID